MLTEQARYRLIGTIFLVALAAVLLPMLFDGEGVAPMQLDAVPAADFEVLPDRSPPPDMTPALEARRELQAEVDSDGYATDTGTRLGEPVLLEEAPADEPPASTAGEGALLQPGPKWAVQVASFAQVENATALRNQLVGDGYTAFLSNVKRGGQTVTRVAVGPFIDRGDAAKEKDELDQRYGVEAAIVRFTY